MFGLQNFMKNLKYNHNLSPMKVTKPVDRCVVILCTTSTLAGRDNIDCILNAAKLSPVRFNRCPLLLFIRQLYMILIFITQ